MFNTKGVLFLLLILTSSLLSAADYYTCKDKRGNTTFSQQPCSPKQIIETLKIAEKEKQLSGSQNNTEECIEECAVLKTAALKLKNIAQQLNLCASSKGSFTLDLKATSLSLCAGRKHSSAYCFREFGEVNTSYLDSGTCSANYQQTKKKYSAYLISSNQYECSITNKNSKTCIDESKLEELLANLSDIPRPKQEEQVVIKKPKKKKDPCRKVSESVTLRNARVSGDLIVCHRESDVESIYGSPTKIEHWSGVTSSDTQWIYHYDDGSASRYIYFKGGRVRDWEYH